jgi:hypothetical protein
MIEEFGYTNAQHQVLLVNLSAEGDFFVDTDRASRLAYFNSVTKGICWLYNGQKKSITENGLVITGFPTVEKDKIVVVYPKDHGTYAAPGNAILYNADGSMDRQLKIPALASEHAKSVKKSDLEDGFFESVRWEKNAEGDVVVAVRIGFDWDWYESRILNPSTGEFGVCLTSGRR